MDRKKQRMVRKYAKNFYKTSAEWFEMVAEEEFDRQNGEKDLADPQVFAEMKTVRDMLLDVGKRLNAISSAFVKKKR